MKNTYYLVMLAVLPVVIAFDFSYLVLSKQFNLLSAFSTLCLEFFVFVLLNLLGARMLFSPIKRFLCEDQLIHHDLLKSRVSALPQLSATFVGLLGILYSSLLLILIFYATPQLFTGVLKTLYYLMSLLFFYAFFGSVFNYFSVSSFTMKLKEQLGVEYGITFDPGRVRIWQKFGSIYFIFVMIFVFMFIDLRDSGLFAETGKYLFIIIDIFAGLIISLLLIFLFSRDIGRPLKLIIASFAAVREGDFSKRATVISDDETGIIIDAFNGMVAGLHERERIREIFGRYVAKSVADEILKREAEIGGDVRLVTIFFSDIANYTTITERLTPHQTVTMLNDYFTFLVDVISRHQGVVNKYIGDSILAMFNAPADDPDHAEHAIRAAIEIQSVSAARRFGDSIPITTRIGINTGLVVAGSIGATQRLEYTVIGDEVNVASRLEALNKQYGTSILVGEKTYELVKNKFRFRYMGELALKGKTDMTRVFAVTDA